MLITRQRMTRIIHLWIAVIGWGCNLRCVITHRMPINRIQSGRLILTPTLAILGA